MEKNVLFIQGAGKEGYEADKALVVSLQKVLGKTYHVHYPALSIDETAPDFGWPLQIGNIISDFNADIILVGHSLGASMILKYLSENSVTKNITGIFLLATPFWKGTEDWVKGLKLQDDFANRLPAAIPIFFYHCEDDEDVGIEQIYVYKQKITQGIFRELKKGGHQFNRDLTLIAQDIQSVVNE